MENTWIISTSEITSKKAGGNNMDFSTSEIAQKKVHGNNVNFSIIEKCTWKLRGFFNQQNYIKKIHVNDVEIRRNLVLDISTLIRCVLPVG